MSTITADPTTQTFEELFLMRLRYKEGQLLDAGGNHPILLNDPTYAWVVYTGKVDLFAVRLQGEQILGARYHLYRAEAGQALLGAPVEGDGARQGLLAVGTTGTTVLKVKIRHLWEMAQEPEMAPVVAALIDQWVVGLSGGVFATLPPKVCRLLDGSQPEVLFPNDAVRPKRGVMWMRMVEGKSYVFGDHSLPPLNGAGYCAIAPRVWLLAEKRGSMEGVTTQTFLQNPTSWMALDTFHRLILSGCAQNTARLESDEQSRLQRKAQSRSQDVEGAFARLAAILNDRFRNGYEGSTNAPLLAACQAVGERVGVTVQTPPPSTATDAQQEPILRIARASRVRVRPVLLNQGWWQKDNGALVAYVEEGQRPVALLPKGSRAYELFDPTSRTRSPVTAAVAETLAPVAYSFYRPLPARALNGWDLLRFGFSDYRRDVVMILLMSIAVGLLGVLTPIISSTLFDSVLPLGAQSQLLAIVTVLVAAGISTAAFQITQNIAVLRIEGRLDAMLQAALWDRLLTLPVPFFREFSAGDLGDRVMGINAIRRILSGTVVGAILASISAVFSAILLFSYNASLAGIAVGLVLAAVVVTLVVGFLQLRFQRETMGVQGRISGMLLQFLTGIAKLRVTGAEGQAFAFWAKEFSHQRQLSYRVRTVNNGMATFNAAFPVLASLAIYAAFLQQSSALSVGEFIGFTVGFGTLLATGVQLSGALIAVASVVPIYERAAPILKALPELDDTKTAPGELTGELEVNHLSFRYKEEGPWILKDVSLKIEPGEFIALVGPSGSGKSTLFRLLIGFENPQAGAIYYDGQELAALDVVDVRRQLGVVLQNGKLLKGSIFTNIVGSSGLTLEHAWEAARMAGLAKDIEKMPMNMHTVISEGGGTLSGGQRQRLLIARAIVAKPRVLFFDEATSALDNATQAVVSESLERLQATRIVIAHRLSTIMNADRIYVLKDGEVVQQGTYQELIKQSGLFADLAKRQTD